MNEPHDLIQGDLAEYALGGLDPVAAKRVERHLRDCARCRNTVREYVAVMEILPFALPLARPSPAARLALQARLSTTHQERRGWRWSWLRPWPGTLVGAAVAVLLLALIGWNFQLRGRDHDTTTLIEQLRARDDVRVVTLAGSAAAPGASGQLLLPLASPQAGLVVSGLPPLPPDRIYQLWFVQADQTWASAGVFRVNDRGEAVVLARFPSNVSAYYGCGITEEPAGGSPAPTGQRILTGSP